MYLLNDGTEVTAEQITAATKEGGAVLVYSRGEGHTATGLMLDGKHWDNRGENYSAWDDSWTATPENTRAALKEAHYTP